MVYRVMGVSLLKRLNRDCTRLCATRLPSRQESVGKDLDYQKRLLIFTVISLFLCHLLAKSTINKLISIETSNNDFLANYLSFFFVALSIQGDITFWVIFGMTFLFVFVSKVSYFNPIFLVFGYNFIVNTETDLKNLLYAMDQRYYYADIYEESRVAHFVRVIKQ